MEYITGICGARGGGKSTLMSYFAIWDMWIGKRDFYCNMPIGGRFIEGEFWSKDLDNAMLYESNDDIMNISMGIDEIQFYADNRESNSNRNKLLNWKGIQTRKQGMNIDYTILFIEWTDLRWRKNTDIVIHCKDLFFSPWGRDNNLGRGEEFYCTMWDMTGVSGMPSRVSGRPMRCFYFYGKPFWSIFNSYKRVGLDTAFTRFDMKRQTVTMGKDGIMETAVINPTSIEHGDYLRVYDTQDIEYVAQVITDQLRAEGIDKYEVNAMRALFAQNGIIGQRNRIGKALKKAGCEYKQKMNANKSFENYYAL